MKINRAISSAILVVLLTAPTAWGQDNIRAAMEAANKEWSAAYNSMNGKAFPALYTKDAILMPPGVQPINGSEAIGQFWTNLIKAGNRKNFAIEIASIQRDGKYAYQTGRWTIDQVKDNGEVTKVGGYRPYFRRTAGRQVAGQGPHLQCLLSVALVGIQAAFGPRCWPSRPDLGERWPSRLVATAAESRLKPSGTIRTRGLRQPGGLPSNRDF